MQRHGTYLVFYFFANNTFEMFEFIKVINKIATTCAR